MHLPKSESLKIGSLKNIHLGSHNQDSAVRRQSQLFGQFFLVKSGHVFVVSAFVVNHDKNKDYDVKQMRWHGAKLLCCC